MWKILVLWSAVLLVSCNGKSKPDSITGKSKSGEETVNCKQKNFDWLVGKWKGLEKQEGKETFELWIKRDNNHYWGHGFVMKGEDTIWQEKMNLFNPDTNWVLQVQTPGNNDLVSFGVTKYGKESFTVENRNHDFPKSICYWKEPGKLKAIVSGDSLKMEFHFQRSE